ncbi:MAG: nitrogen regulation protein [Pseudomonadota bacterium]|jgi:two-component system nitrogen regulation response regulator GlnG
MSSVWVVDDDQSIRWVLEKALTREGFDVRLFSSSRDCVRALESGRPAALVSDIRMPGDTGIELLQSVKISHPDMPVIIMTAFSDLDSAVSAFQSGAFEYLPKPFDLPKAVELIRRAVEQGVSDGVGVGDGGEPGVDMLGQSPAMQEVFRAIGRLSQSNVTVLITGESGTGKELVARALHKHSPRHDRVFVALNTAAIPRDLLESELFGHERGAFTGAQQMRRGRFEQAEGGTLFLDEIGDMPAELQTRLLRVLSDGHFYRVGGHQPLRANVRVIAATHQNLEERVRQGLFREDLFHRLNVIRLRLPALRERPGDVPLLVRHFLQASARELGGEPKRPTEAALQTMAGFSWPGNVRQLENVCRWLTVMAPAQVIDVKDLPPEVRGDSTSAAIDGAASDRLSAQLRPAGLSAPALSGQGSGASGSGLQGSGVAASAAMGSAAVGSVTSGSGESGAGLAEQGAGGSPDSGISRFALPSETPQFAVSSQSAMHGVGSATQMAASSSGAVPRESAAWLSMLEREVSIRLAAQSPQERSSGESVLMDEFAREFEAVLIRTALRHTRGRRIDAALRLGIGRNTITRKIQDLRLEDDSEVL